MNNFLVLPHSSCACQLSLLTAKLQNLNRAASRVMVLVGRSALWISCALQQHSTMSVCYRAGKDLKNHLKVPLFLLLFLLFLTELWLCNV